MLEDKLTSILQKYLGEYFSGLSKEALKVSVWKGDIELKNISLRPEALGRLQLPVVVKSGIVKVLHVQIPWKSLGRSSIVIHLDGLELLLGPNESVYLDPTSVLEAKRKRVQDAEELIMSRRDVSAGKSTEDTRTWLSTVVDGVIGNLKLSISNIHIRYEDSLSELHAPAAVGIKLDRLAAFSVDKNGKETYVSGRKLDCTRKAVELHGLSVYCQTTLNDNVTAPSDRWQVSASEYLVEPLNGSASYSRAGKHDPALSSSPQQDLAVTLDSISFTLSEDQYQLIMKLADKFSAAQRQQEFVHLRPSCSVKECPSAWWNFAINATLQRIKKGRSFTDWNELIRRSRIRNAYVPLYAKFLRRRAAQKPFEKDQDLLILEADVEPEVLLQWRLVAHDLVSQELKKQKGEARINAGSSQLDSEDWTQLQALLPDASGHESTVSEIVHTRWSVHVKKSRSIIKDSQGSSLLSLSCMGIQLASSMHLETTEFRIQVGPYRVESPEGTLLQSGQGPQSTLDFLLVLHPKGQNLDWLLHGSVQQAHVLFIKPSLDRMIDFFQSGDALSPALALDTADVFEQTVDEVKRQAQAQLTNFMRSVSRFEVVLDVRAPRITVPSASEGFQRTNLVLNLGHLLLNSSSQPSSASISSTTSDLYMKFLARLENVSACFQVFNGTASPRKQPADTEVQPLKEIHMLEECTFVSSMEQIWVPQPDFPTLRISARAPFVAVHFSPEIYHCLLKSAAALQGCDSQAASVVPWESAEYKGSIHVLTKKGIASTEVAWQRMVGAVAGPFLYILSSENSRSYQQRISLRNKLLICLAQDGSSGPETALAICPPGCTEEKAMRTSASLIFKADTMACDAWRSVLFSAIHRASVASLPQLRESLSQGPKRQSQVRSADSMAVLFVGEMDMLRMMLHGKRHVSNPRSLTEIPLLELDVSSAVIETSLFDNSDLILGATLASLEVKDLVSCDAGPSCQFLARSTEMSTNVSMPRDWSLNEGEAIEVFHDATESSFPTHLSQESTGRRSSLWSMADYYDAMDFPVDLGDKPLTAEEVPSFEGRPALLDRPWKRTSAFVQVQYIMRVPDSPNHTGVDAELILDLSGLSFYCNRPTVLALIGVSLDMTTTPSLAPDPAKSQHGGAEADSSSLSVKAEAAEDEERTLFRLTICVDELRATLNQDNGLPLAVLTKQKLMFQLQVETSSFCLDAELGQLRICDLSLGEGHQYGWMFSPRNTKGQSFAKITLASSNHRSLKEESPGYSLSVQTSEIRVVYLNRFTHEVTSYFLGLSPPEDPENDLHSPRSEEEPPAHVSATATPIKLAITFGELLLLLPESSSSKDYLEFDVGRLGISNSIEIMKLLGDGMMHSVSLDVMKVEVDGIRLHVMANGHLSDNMIERLVGLQVSIERPLDDPTGSWPGCHISVKVGHLQGGMCSAEYGTVLDCVSGNFSEMPRSTLATVPAPDSTAGTSVAPLKHVDLKTSVHFQSLALLLYDGSSRETKFAKLQVADLSLQHFLHSGGISQLFLSVLRVLIKDLTPGLATEERWVLGIVDNMEEVVSTAGSETALSAEWPTHLSSLPHEHSGPEHIHPSMPMLILESQFTSAVQCMSIRIQRPRLLLAPSFISHLSSFFTRSEDANAASAAAPEWSHAHHLRTPYTLQHAFSVLKISSQNPLVADAPGVTRFTFDGNEGSIELLSAGITEGNAAEAPLIIIGPGKHLHFKNVRIYGAVCLPLVVKLGAGSSYSVDEADGVRLLPMRLESRPSQQLSKATAPQHVPEQSSVQWKFDLQAIGMELIAMDQARWAAPSLSPETLLRLKASFYLSIQTVRDMSEVNIAVRSSGINIGSGLCVVEPVDCRIRLTSSTGYTDIHFSVSDLRTHFTFNTLELVLRMQEKFASSVYSVAERPPHLCLQFKKVWAYAGRFDMQRISFWRPIAPPGFVVLGDCLTTDHAPPTRGVLAVSLAGGYVKRPISFAKLWSSEEEPDVSSGQGCSVWEPVPPPGFVAVGCVAHPGAQPPPSSAVYCIDASYVCAVALRGCITVEMTDELQAFKFWRVENAMSTFSAHQEQEAACAFAFDLRYQLPVNDLNNLSSAPSDADAATTGAAVQQVDDSFTFEVPSVAFSSRQQEGFQQTHFFKLVWESHVGTSSSAVSVWRPLCPEGFAFVGDVISLGSSPPEYSVIIEEVDDGLLVKPSSWKLLSYISAQGTHSSVAFWSAIPPPGYSTLGVIVTGGKTAPAEDSFRCVRNDACVPVKIASASVFEVVSGNKKPLCKLWPVENQVGSFLVTTKSRKGPPRRLGLGFFVLDEQRPVSRVYVEVSLPVFSLTLYDDFGSLVSPLVKTSLDNLVVKSLYYRSSVVHQVSSGCSVDAFNTQQDAWEPCLEPWHGMVRAELAGGDVSETPLSTCRVVSNSKVNINLSSSNVNHFGEAYSDWLKLLEAKEDAERAMHLIEHDEDDEGLTDEHTHATERPGYIVQHNSSGIELYFRLVDRKSGARVFCLPSGSQACIVVPAGTSSLHPSSEQHSNAQRGCTLAFGIGELQIPKDILPNPEELVCSVSLTSAIDVNGFQCTQHARTSMKVPAGDGNMWLFFWNEVFLFESTYEEGEAVCVAVEQSAFSGSALLSFKWAPKLAVEQLGNVGSSSQSTTAHSWLSSKHGPASGDHGTAHLSVFHHCGKIGADGRLEFLDEVPDLPIQERWQPFQMSLAEDGPWTAISSVYGGGIVPKQVDGTVLAVQVSMVEGEKHLDIRSLVTVVNKTAATLEVCLCPRSLLSHSNDQPSNAASHAAVSEQASQNSAQAKGDGGVEVVEIFENERHLPFVSWSSSNLLPIDPKCWSDPISKTSSKKFKDPELPVGWVWSSDWHIEVSEHVDKDGWAYFPSFLEASWPPRGTVHRVKGFVDAVRRRRWVRFRQQSPGTKAPDRILCGLVEPGGTLPLPVPLPSSGQTEPCIQLRPCVTRYDDSAATATSFSWGSVDAHVTKTLKETTDSKQARLSFSDFCLTHLGRTEELLFCQQTSTESEQSETSWMLVQAIGTPLSKRSSFTLTMDWEILVEPPITLCNFLPEPITLSIWSSDPPSTDILLKEEELILEPGAKKGILSVHPGGRLLVALKIRDVWIAPDESEERVTIFHPQDPLPSEVSLVHKDTHRYLQVSIDRAWSATFGTLKEVSFSVPCWVDTAGCPPLVLSLSHTTSVTAMGSGSFQNFKRAWKEHKGEAKKQSKMQGQLSRDEVVHGGDEGSTVMLSRCGETSVIRFALGQGGGLVEVYGPDLSIAAVQSQSTMCNSQATAADGSYLPLVVFMDVSPYGSKGSKVLKIRPFMSLTNRLGEPVFVRPPEAEEHVTELAPSDWHRPLVCPRGYEDDTFQVRTSSSTWSYPLKLSQDAEVIAVVRLLSDNSRRFIRMDARSGGSASKRMISFRFGGLHLPYKLENHSSCSVSFRQSGLSSAAWEVLSPRSAADFAWEDPDGDLFLEAYAHLANETTGESSGSALDPPDTMMFDLSEAADLGSLPLPATGGHLHAQSFDCDGVCIVRFTNGCDSTVEEEESHLHQRDVEVAAPAGSLFGPQPSVNLSSKGSRVEISLDLMSVGLSIIDHRPQELLYAFSEGFLLDYRYDGQDDSSRVKLILKSLRIDNQLPLSPLPVLLFLEQKGVPEKDYVFKFLISSRGSMEQGEVCYPKLRLWLAQEAWQVNVHEAIVWRMWELTESICWDHFVAAGAGGVDGGAVAAVQVDPMIRIDRLVVSGAHLKLTLEAEPTSRPAQLLGAWNSLVTAAGNTKRMPVRLSGAIAEARRLRRSIFMEAVVRHVMRDLLHQSLRLLSGVDVLGVISSTLTALGHGALRLVHKEDMSNRHFQQALGNQLDNVGEGLLYGAEAMAKGVALGLTDVIVRSQSGYENHGPPGLLLGLSKGLAGLVLHPVTGFLHSLAFIVAGIDASAGSCARMVQRKPHLQRLRLPRAISVEGVVHEYNKESAVGQMALFMAEAGSYFGKRDIFRDHSKFALSDAYVKHIILPNSRLLLITNRRVMMLKCPVDPAGQIDSLTLVQVPSLVRWDVPWDNLLALEIKSIRSFPRPVVCVHMREPTPRRLYTIIRCPETHPAEQVLADIAFAFEAYGPKPVNIQAGNIPAEPSQHSFLSTATSQSSLSHTSSSARPIQPTQSRRFGRQHSVQTSERALAIGRHALSSSEDNPPIMARRFALPSMHSNSIPSHMETDTFIRAWVVEDGQSFCSTSCQGDSVEAGHFAIWKPVPPEGYISLGDVAWRGLTPPPAVRVYSTAPASVAAGSCSALAMPKDYFLVWRNRVSKTEDAVSIWRPIPPEGYVCIGCVAVGGYDKPAHGDPRLAVRCVRQDLVRPAEVEEELWHATTRWDQSWGCHVHQVNNSARTFVAVRSREEIGGVENGWDVR